MLSKPSSQMLGAAAAILAGLSVFGPAGEAGAEQNRQQVAAAGYGLDPALIRKAHSLPRLPIADEQRGGYDRDSWGGWEEGVEGTCLNMRHAVLAMSSRIRTRTGKNGCSVTGGQWVDVYTGKTMADPQAIDVDHVVAVQEADDSGAKRWTARQKAAFYNDPMNLVPVDREVNKKKAAKGPEEWLPASSERRCAFLVRWVEVKLKYGLTADRRESEAIEDGIDAYCR